MQAETGASQGVIIIIVLLMRAPFVLPRRLGIVMILLHAPLQVPTGALQMAGAVGATVHSAPLAVLPT